jgi:signal transduction histidine kinase/CheY-like chemotaxis protein
MLFGCAVAIKVVFVKAKSSPLTAVQRAVHALRLRGPLASDPTAQMLHVLLVVVAIWMAVGFLSTAPIGPLTWRRTLYNVALQSSLIAALVVLRRGRFRGAVLVYLAGTWIWATLAISAVGGIRTNAIVLYATLPVSAAWLLGYKASLWTAGVCIITLLFFAVLEMIGMPPPRTIPGTPLGALYTAVQAMLIGTIPVGQVIRRLLATLQELEAYKQNLELLVDQRTAELIKARDEAEAANRAKSVFLATMSHELRTPLNAILGFSSLLRERSTSDQQRDDLDIIKRSGEHLLGLINDVLDVVKIELGRSELEIAPCNLGKLVEDATDMIRPRAAAKGLSLRMETPQMPMFIRADAARLRQVLLNLLSNAVKFTDHGSVVLRVNAVPASAPGELRFIFEIEDTGEGIAAGDQAAIFEAFVQTNTAKRREGVGLGLTISRQIVELMGGTIQVESTPGQGSRFCAEIPFERVQTWESNRGPVRDHHKVLADGQPEYRVLIVEDQQENWMVLERLLENAGFRVRVAENGEQGIKEFLEWHPQFIWMDLRMPVMDGVAATRRIRACEGGREVKIAAVTVSGFASQRREILAEGLDDYVRKPYRPTEIFECMARHLGVRYRDNETPEPSAESSGQQVEDLTAVHLSRLPVELRNALREAVITLDPMRISGAIELISQQSPEVGLILAHYADRSAYSRIFAATEAQ